MSAPGVLVAWTARRDAHRLATDLAAELIGTHPGPLHHTCGVCGSVEHGRPSFDAPVHVSVAHAPLLSIVALSAVAPVGVDIEARGAADLAWVETEALAKAHGTGMIAPLPAGIAARRWVLDVPGHVAVLMTLSEDLPEIEVRPSGTEAPAR